MQCYEIQGSGLECNFVLIFILSTVSQPLCGHFGPENSLWWVVKEGVWKRVLCFAGCSSASPDLYPQDARRTPTQDNQNHLPNIAKCSLRTGMGGNREKGELSSLKKNTKCVIMVTELLLSR